MKHLYRPPLAYKPPAKSWSQSGLFLDRLFPLSHNPLHWTMGPKGEIKANSATHGRNGYSQNARLGLQYFIIQNWTFLLFMLLIQTLEILTFLWTRFLEVCGHRQLHILHKDKKLYINQILCATMNISPFLYVYLNIHIIFFSLIHPFTWIAFVYFIYNVFNEEQKSPYCCAFDK